MMKTFLIPLLLFAGVSAYAVSSQELRKKALSRGLKPIPADFEQLKAVVDSPDNPLSIEKINLGKKLFFDKNLSLSREIACATCHDVDKGGNDEKPTAIGHNNLPNPSHLNTPTVLNNAFANRFFWDGRSPTLRDQAKGPAQAPFEMAATPELIEERVKENPEYVNIFERIFGNNNPITFDNITKAIATYERILVTRSAYDAFLEGDDNALSEKAKNGLELFIDLGCKGCHHGYAVGGRMMQKFPLRDYNSWLDISFKYEDGRRQYKDVTLNFKQYHPFPFENIGGFMGQDGKQKFRVPILRNITKTAPYFHNGTIKELKKAIFLMGRHQVGVNLSDEQIESIEAFLKSLEGDVFDYGIKETP